MLLQFSLRLSQDGSGRGAAIVAAVSFRMMNNNWQPLTLSHVFSGITLVHFEVSFLIALFVTEQARRVHIAILIFVFAICLYKIYGNVGVFFYVETVETADKS